MRQPGIRKIKTVSALKKKFLVCLKSVHSLTPYFSERHKGILKKEVKFIYLFSKCKRKFKKGVFENEKIIMVYIDRTGGRIYGSNSSSTNYGSSFR
jgi:hypothetical protein